MNKELSAIKERIDSLPSAEVKAQPTVEANLSLAFCDDLAKMKKETEETNSNLNKLKDNVQNVVKKIKEEMTANNTNIQASLDKLQVEINVLQNNPEPIVIEKVNSIATDPNEAALKKAAKKDF